jgi:hypothetical protein
LAAAADEAPILGLTGLHDLGVRVAAEGALHGGPLCADQAP